MCMFLYMASSHSVRICLEGRGVGGVGKRPALSSIIVTTIEVCVHGERHDVLDDMYEWLLSRNLRAEEWG